MVDMLTIAAAAAWLLVFGWCVVVTGRPALRVGTADPGRGPAPAKPALVNLAVTRCRLNGAAYPATILDLAAGGYLAITGRAAGQLWCDLPASSPVEAGLARSERLVLAGVRALAAGHGAPFEALAESCASDVRGRWDPFERAVRAEGKRAGITQPRLSAAARVMLYAGAGGVGALVFVAGGGSEAGVWAPATAAFFAFALPAYWTHSLGRQDRLTARGSAVGAWAARAAGKMAAAWRTPGPASAPTSAELSQLAWAVAAGAPVQVPGATPGLVTGVRPGRGRAGARTGISGQLAGTPRPSAAWSSFGGEWRLVRIGQQSFPRTHPAFWLVLAAWLALMAYVSSLLPSPAGVLIPAVLVAGSAAAILGGVRGLAAWRARPAEASFRGQVIARWLEHRRTNDGDSYISCIAVDDGERSWSFDVRGPAFGQLALGDMVAVRASPRSGKLLSLIPAEGRTGGGAPAPGRAGPAARGGGPRGDAAAGGAAADWAAAGDAAASGVAGGGTAAGGVGGGGAVAGGAGADWAAAGDAAASGAAAGGAAAGDAAAGGVAAGEVAASEVAAGQAAAAEVGAGEAAAGEARARKAGAGGAGAGEAVSGTAGAGVDAGATPPGALLAAGEVSAAVGRPVRATALVPEAASVLYRGEGVTVVVTVADAFLGSLTGLARRHGKPLPGVGDEAWLLNRGRTAVMRAGGLTAKITIGGSAARSLPPDVLPRLAATVAERLPHQATPPGMQALGDVG
jgi:hypothetical protein